MNAPSSQLKPGSLFATALARLYSRCTEQDRQPNTPASPGARDVDGRLFTLADTLDLSLGEQLAVALCYGVQVDPHIARLVAQVQAPIGGAQPYAGLAATLFADEGLDVLTIAAGQAVASGLLSIGGAEAPLPERPLEMPLHVAAALGGHIVCPDGASVPTPARICLPEALDPEITKLCDILLSHLGKREGGVIVLRCRDARDGRAMAACLAERTERQLVEIESGMPGRHAGWLHATGALCLMVSNAGPGESVEIEPPKGYDGPVVVIGGTDGSYTSSCSLTEWKMPVPDHGDREKLWRRAGLHKPAAAAAARRYRHGAARIAELASHISGKSAKSQLKQLGQALQSGSSPLDKLARRSNIPVARNDIVLPAELDVAVERLRRRIGQRNLLAKQLGPTLRARYRPGVRALFTGDSGTGKTLAAHWLAQEAGLPLYRVDLSALTSKWIGETEKNLSSLLDLAEHADVMLFFDEADSLFGARTDVGDSHDRFANAQTNFLLQRIEEFDGVALLATNGRDRFDPAFVRRLDAILEFPLPDAEARLKIWRTHLGDGHSLTNEELNSLATQVDLAGGHVRNIVLSAASMAMSEDRPVSLGDLRAASAEEYMKLGRAPPPLAAC
ncbi:MAG: ATP-binding protein [Sphingorhabdus sp.]